MGKRAETSGPAPPRRKVDGGRVTPLLRWAGSKRSLLDDLLALVPRIEGRYFEPFAGSACLYFGLRPRAACLADHNDELMGTYRTIRRAPREVATLALGWPTDEAQYYRLRAVDPLDLTAVQRAARFVFLNRLCFNGVYRTNRSGAFNVPFGRAAGAIPPVERWVRCGGALRAARLETSDFEVAVRDAAEGDFVYLDPPYTRGTRDAYGVYGYGSFTQADFGRLMSALDRLDRGGARFLLSYRASPEVVDATSGWEQRFIEVTAQVGGKVRSRSMRRELLVLNYEPPLDG
jgi:DNA adenine methylase